MTTWVHNILGSKSMANPANKRTISEKKRRPSSSGLTAVHVRETVREGNAVVSLQRACQTAGTRAACSSKVSLCRALTQKHKCLTDTRKITEI